MKQKRNSNGNQLTMALLNNKALLILIVLVMVAGIMTDGLFFSYKNLSSVSRQIAVNAMLGLGFTVLLASGSIDLSVGNMLSFLGVVYAIFTLHMPLPIAIIGALQTFSTALVMTDGGPVHSTTFYVLTLYRRAFQDMRMGYASAMAWVLMVVTLVLTLCVYRLGNSKVYYEN